MVTFAHRGRMPASTNARSLGSRSTDQMVMEMSAANSSLLREVLYLQASRPEYSAVSLLGRDIRSLSASLDTRNVCADLLLLHLRGVRRLC
jgi:hypothetical protein